MCFNKDARSSYKFRGLKQNLPDSVIGVTDDVIGDDIIRDDEADGSIKELVTTELLVALEITMPVEETVIFIDRDVTIIPEDDIGDDDITAVSDADGETEVDSTDEFIEGVIEIPEGDEDNDIIPDVVISDDNIVPD
jgi:hypothetical protein